MYKQRALLFLFLFCICTVSRYFSQISISNPTIGGCAPFAVTYTAPAGATGNWNFGNGQTTGNSTGGFSYLNPGTYTITYSGTLSGNPVNFTVTAYVITAPTASFSVSQPANSCAPKTVTFTDMSSGPSIVKWQWIYGDGGGQTYQSGGTTTYVYTIPGVYTPTLQVSNIYACTDKATVATVSVFATPTAVINSNPTNLFSCTPPLTAIFSASNSAGSNPTYAWNFGNNQTSTSMTSGSITYTAVNNYVVTLTVTANGCSSTATVPVIISQTTLAATVPATVCLNKPFTATVQTNQAFSSWTLGAGSNTLLPGTLLPSTFSLPGYTSTGVRTITITAGAPPCQATITRTVLVDKVVANFTVSPPPYSCSSPFTALFTNLSSTNATQFSWHYPTWQKDTIRMPFSSNPNLNLNLTENSLNPYVIYTTYAPTLTLVAVSPAGCVDSIALTLDSITRPTAWFFKDKSEGCVPLTVTFFDTSFVYPFNPVTTYTWNSGENPAQTFLGSGPNILSHVFTYSVAGTYTPFLTIQTSSGCTDISFIDTVYVVSPPMVSFTISPTGTICPGQALQVVNTTAASVATQIDHWHVEGDDGFFSGCISDPNPSWNFTHIGTHTLTLTGYIHECPGTAATTETIFVSGPIAQGRYATNCTNRLSVDFSSYLQGATSATLDFNDGSPVHVITGNPSGDTSDLVTHNYTLTGDYTALLTAINPTTTCGVSNYTMLVTVRNVTAVITSPTITCLNAAIVLDASASKDVFTGCSRGYVWYVDGQPPIDTTGAALVQGFGSPGPHTVFLMVKDINSCSDTLTQHIRVSDVTPAFLLSPPSICVNGTVQFTNTSTTTSTDVITNYSWNFGDGQGSNLQTPSNTYTMAYTPFTTYSVILTASNSMGCVKSIGHTVKVIQPDASFFPSAYNICLGPTTVTFYAQGTNVSYSLNLGGAIPPVISASGNIPYTFTSPGIYPVFMTAKDANGCLSTNSNTVLISAQQTPTANFDFSSTRSTTNDDVICSGFPVSFTNTSLPIQPYTINWNLGSGQPVVPAPVVNFLYSYSVTTSIAVSLTVSTANFCTSTITRSFTVYNPRAKINVSKTTICLGDPVTLSIKDTTGSGIQGWVWDYGDASATGGTITAGSAPPSSTVHTYNSYPASGTASISLIYYSSGYACYDYDTVSLNIIKVDASIKRNNELTAADWMHCINIKDMFYNTTSGTPSFLIWNFGDGGSSTDQNPSYTYTLPGVYQVSLAVSEGSLNCKAVAAANMTINALPVAAISAPDSLCRNTPFDLTGTGTSTAGIIGYQWSPAASVNNSTLASAVGTASASLNYSLVVTDGNGCVSPPVEKSVYIQQPPKQVAWDTTVVIGQPIPIQANAGTNFSYTWSPLSDLSCSACSYPISSSTVNVTYSLQVADNLRCYLVTSTYSVYIDPVTSVDVPTAFTPNGDGVNDFIYVDGWGIKKLNYFRIFNRWGELLFESNDIKTGWDGNFKGVPQNMETYVYQVSVETYLDTKGLQKTSSFRLIR